MKRKRRRKGEEEGNGEMRMLVYGEMRYGGGEVEGKDGKYVVWVERVEEEVVDGMRRVDGGGLDLEEEMG